MYINFKIFYRKINIHINIIKNNINIKKINNFHLKKLITSFKKFKNLIFYHYKISYSCVFVTI